MYVESYLLQVRGRRGSRDVIGVLERVKPHCWKGKRRTTMNAERVASGNAIIGVASGLSPASTYTAALGTWAREW
jgi:hypothetical protein